MSLPEQIRRSAEAGDFAAAARRFAEHSRHVRAAIENRACGAAIIEEAGALLAYVRTMALARRSHLEYRLQKLRSGLYVNGAYR